MEFSWANISRKRWPFWVVVWFFCWSWVSPEKLETSEASSIVCSSGWPCTLFQFWLFVDYNDTEFPPWSPAVLFSTLWWSHNLCFVLALIWFGHRTLLALSGVARLAWLLLQYYPPFFSPVCIIYGQFMFIKQCDCIITVTKIAKTASTLFNNPAKNTRKREKVYLGN